MGDRLPVGWECSLQMGIQTYPDNSSRGIYGSNSHIDNHVYQDYTLCTDRYRAYSRNCALSFALTVEVNAIVFEAWMLLSYVLKILAGSILSILVFRALDF